MSVGSNSRIRSLVSSDTEVIDLQGKTLIPALMDNHVRFIRHALRRDHEARIDGVTSRPKALAIISARAKSLKRGAWVLIIGGWSPCSRWSEEKSFSDRGYAAERISVSV